LHNLGMVLLTHEGTTKEVRQARIARAQGSILEATRLLDGLRSEFPEVPSYREELAIVYKNLGVLGEGWKQFDRAVASLGEARKLADQLVTEAPKVPKYRVLAAEVDQKMSYSRSQLGEVDQALQYAREAIEQLASLKPTDADLPSYLAACLGRASFQLAKVLALKQDWAGAREAAVRAESYHRQARKAGPESPIYRKDLLNDLAVLALIRLELHDVAGAARDAEEMPRIGPDDPFSYIQAAVSLIRCAAKDPGQEGRFYDRAMELLTVAVTRHLVDPSKLDQKALDPLRDREDFRRLRQFREIPAIEARRTTAQTHSR
jgi:tetratricopeptide (TPR) repeat protein